MERNKRVPENNSKDESECWNKIQEWSTKCWRAIVYASMSANFSKTSIISKITKLATNEITNDSSNLILYLDDDT